MNRFTSRPQVRLLALPLLAFLTGCGGGSSTPAPPAAVALPPVASDGILNVYLIHDGLAPAYSQMNLMISGLDIQVGGAWRKVPLDALAPTGLVPPPAAQAVDLLSLNTASAALATQVPWPAGANTQLRFTFAPGATVQLSDPSDQTAHNLELQTVVVAAMGLPGSFSVTPYQTTNLWIVADVSHAVNPDPLDATQYVFQPGAMRGYDRAATGSITGTLTPAVPSDPTAPPPAALAAVAVTAQLQVAAAGNSSCITFRTAQTDANGKYTLDFLPLNYTWSVVSQPVVGTQVYNGMAGVGIPLGPAPNNAGSWDAVFTPSAGVGTLSGTVQAPLAAGEVDVVDLIQVFPFPDGPCSFSMRSAQVVPSPAAAQGSAPGPGGTFSFTGVPAGTYSAQFNRYSYTPDTGAVLQRSTTNTFSIGDQATTTLQF